MIDAAIELFSEDNLQPGPAEVALRCGLSSRSVYRYFEDTDQLLRAAVERKLELVIPLYKIHAIGRGTLEERIDRFVGVRLGVHDSVGPTARAAQLLALSKAVVRENFDMARGLLLDQVERHFAPEFAGLDEATRSAKVAVVDALFQFEALDYFRMSRGFSEEETHRVLVAALHDLLDPLVRV